MDPPTLDYRPASGQSVWKTIGISIAGALALAAFAGMAMAGYFFYVFFFTDWCC